MMSTLEEILSNKDAKAYIAAPFFKPDQVMRVEDVKNILNTREIDYFSPKDDNYCDPKAMSDRKQEVFEGNVLSIKECDFMIAITNGYDPGTLFECGVAYEAGIPIIYLADGLTTPFNLMLAQSCIAIAKSMVDLENILDTKAPIEEYFNEEIE